MIGASIAWFLASNDGFQGRILVVEKDPSYASCSTAHSNSCIRQQFSSEINVRISQFGAEYAKGFCGFMGDDPDVPDIPIHNFGYMYLAGDAAGAEVLRANQQMQARLGAGTKIMQPDEIASAYPFYDLDGVVLGCHNTVDEGYFDGGMMFSHWRRCAKKLGVEFVSGEVVAIGRAGAQVNSVTLGNGDVISAGFVVNAAGPRAAQVAAMAGLELPVEARARYTYVIDAAVPLDRDLPLTVDMSGVHMRTDGKYYMIGAAPDADGPVAPDDFSFDHGLWMDKVWPTIATRIPAFESVKVISEWVGHYAYNTLDQNAIVGPHDEVSNFIFANGFSGHGFQQAPAVGRGIAEMIIHGEYRSLDLSPLGYGRIRSGTPLAEGNVI